MREFSVVIEVHKSVLAQDEDDARTLAEDLRSDIEGQHSDTSVYLEKVEEV